MKITLYKSALCPRCHAVRAMLKEFQQRHPDVELKEVELLSSPLKTLQAGVRMIPAVELGGQRLAMVLPDRTRLFAFLEENIASGTR